MLDWHTPTCLWLTLEEGDGFSFCSSCGSVRPGTYIHDRIQEKREVRLLTIHPGDFDDPINGSLAKENLGHILPTYEAISYTWADESGDATKSKAIFLDGKPFPVTKNCEAALRRVRREGSRRVVWIDSICIDQDDSQERTNQVQLMAQIYTRADAVLIYVGEADLHSTKVLASLGNATEAEDSDDADLESAWAEFLCRRYFWRVWVLQEVALARKAFLICGETSVPWTDLTSNKRLSSIVTQDKIVKRFRKGDHRLAQVATTWQQWKENRKSTPSVPGMPDHDPLLPEHLPVVLSFSAPKFRGVEDMLNLLDIASFCDSTDPRDKVFAILGLIAGSETLDLGEGYDSTAADVYIKVALFIAGEAGLMALLCRAVCRKKTAALPPWVPDWTRPAYAFPEEPLDALRRTILENLPTDGQSDVKPSIDHEGNTVTVQVIRIGTVADVLLAGFGIEVFPSEDSSSFVVNPPPASLMLSRRVPDQRTGELIADKFCLYKLLPTADIPADPSSPPALDQEIAATGLLILSDSAGFAFRGLVMLMEKPGSGLSFKRNGTCNVRFQVGEPHQGKSMKELRDSRSELRSFITRLPLELEHRDGRRMVERLFLFDRSRRRLTSSYYRGGRFTGHISEEEEGGLSWTRAKY
jgi:hypothetical protein